MSTNQSIQSNESINILVMVCGSVATIKLPQLLEQLRLLSDIPAKRLVSLRVVTTEHAMHFFDYQKMSQTVKVYRDVDEWTEWTQMGDNVLHIELRKWASIGLLAPIDANTIAKISVGMCDNLLTSIVRAWDLTKPLIYCPAMNVQMWRHPITETNLKALSAFGFIQFGPISKRLACGDLGIGAMAEVNDIVQEVKRILKL